MSQLPPGDPGRTSDARATGGIAIVGLSCRLPGASDPEAFWALVRDGVDAITEVPRDRFDVERFYAAAPGLPGRMSTRWGGFVEGVDLFDPHLFRIAPREVASIDPQQRLLLELAWEALEDAGLDPERLAGGRTGVFVGISTNDYGVMMVRDPRRIDAFTGTGGSLSIAANRLSYVLDLRGPSLAVDTACSSALVALHLACQSLRRGECASALVGGVNLILSPDKAIGYSQARMMAADGRCKAFDARADGFVRGEGGAVVVLKPLAAALGDGDPIWGIVRGTAVNQDGLTNGLSAPSGAAQRAVIREALADAGVRPDEIGYVEAHGTGTALGDPIEMDALVAELSAERPPDRPCLVASVKTNIGHLEAASGVAGLVKVLLALDHGLIPPHLHLRSLNPRIALAGRPFAIPTEPRPWPREGRVRYAGLSGFGFGGTNAHVVIEEAPAASPRPTARARPWHLLTLRAASEPALQELALRHARHLRARSDLDLADVCATANDGRAALAQRLAVVVSDREQAAEALHAFARGGSAQRLVSGRARRPAPRIAMLFTGQGSQYPGMGRELYDSEPGFRAALERSEAILRPCLERSLLDVLFSATSPVAETAYAQPALFALEHALFELLGAWGVRPVVVLGHSVGAYAAACAAGVFDLEAGLRWIAERGRLMQALPRDGEMIAVEASEAEVRERLAPYARQVALAAVNAPRSVVVSGERDAVRALAAQLEAAGCATRRLDVSHAFHSPLMDHVHDAFARAAEGMRLSAPGLPVVSDTTGAVDGEIVTAAYWTRHLREPVRFADAVATVLGLGVDAFLEIGPRPVLLPLARACAGERPALWLPTLRADRSDWQQLLASVGALHVAGTAVDWRALDGPFAGRRVRLPTYPFQRQRCWLETDDDATAAAQGPASGSAFGTHPLLGDRVPSALPEVQYLRRLAPGQPSWLADHAVHGRPVVPAAALIDMALAAAAERLRIDRLVLGDVVFLRPLCPTPGEATWLQLVWDAAAEGAGRFRIFSREAARSDGPWMLHASGTACAADATAGEGPREDGDLEASGEEVTVDAFYARCREHGLEYGPAFRTVERLWASAGGARAELRVTGDSTGAVGHFAHPALLDGAFQVLAAAAAGDETGTFVPARIERLRVAARPGLRAEVRARLRPPAGERERIGDLRLADAAGDVLVEVEGFALRRIEGDAPSVARAPGDDLYEVAWPARERPPRAEGGPRQTWLVLGDADGTTEEVAARLRSSGHAAVRVERGSVYARLGTDSYRVDPGASSDLAHVLADHAALTGVVCLWGLRPALALATDASLAAGEEALRDVLHLLQALVRVEAPTRTVLVTCGAQTVGRAQFPGALAQAALWGLGRAVAREHPELGCTLVDLDPHDGVGESARRLGDELLGPDGEDEVALRQGVRHVPRLARAATGATSDAGEPPPRPFRVRTPRYGDLDALAVGPAPRSAPRASEVEIEVRAAGLNLRDVLGALGMLEPFAAALGIRSAAELPLGFECAGTVVTTGADVRELQVGDDVIALALGGLASHVSVDARLAARKPEGLTFEEAASLPVPGLTAIHALSRLARVRRGESVLIHSAAGGVGLAAVQLAQAAGATVFATASPPKWDLLRSMGVEHVMSSRTLDFADEVRARTGGAGVDVVLNSLAGEFIPRSLAALAADGRFVEIGKLGVWDAARVAAVRPRAAYHVFDLGEEARRDPSLVATLLDELTAAVGAGSLRPLTARVFPIGETPLAFRTMAQARHVGKIVIRMPRTRQASPVQADGMYLITGGLGGLGLEVAKWLATLGARHLYLLGRHAPGPDARRAIDALEKEGVAVRVRATDVADRAALAAALDELRACGPPLRGVIHAAGMLDDGWVEDQTWTRFERVLAPKVRGAWNLSALTQADPLDFFVCFSSAAALCGSPGQSSYAAANAFLDALAHHRRATGRPALSVDFGPWAEVGMAAALPERERARLSASGISSLAPEDALAALGRALAGDAPQVAVVRVDAARLRAPSSAFPALLRDWVGHPSAAAKPAGANTPPAAGTPDRPEVMLAYLQRATAKVLGLGAGHLPDPESSMKDLGLESFMAFELKTTLQADLGVELPTRRLFDGTSVAALASILLEQLVGRQDAATGAAPPSITPAPSRPPAPPAPEP